MTLKCWIVLFNNIIDNYQTHRDVERCPSYFNHNKKITKTLLLCANLSQKSSEKKSSESPHVLQYI